MLSLHHHLSLPEILNFANLHILSDPGVSLEVLELGPFRARRLEAARYKIHKLCAHSLWELKRQLSYPIMSCSMGPCLKGRLADNELIGEDAQTPDVNRVIICLGVTMRDHLRRQVVKCATLRLPAIRGRMDRPAIVSKLDHSEAIKQVFRLYVPVNDIFRVDVPQGLAHLIDVAGCFTLSVVTVGLSLEVLVELTFRAILQDQVNLLAVEEKPVEL